MNYIYAVILDGKLVDVWKEKPEAKHFADTENSILKGKHCKVKRVSINI